jgi:hypothetical protein
MKFIKIINLPNRKKPAICVIDSEKPNVLYTVGYIYYNEELFKQALIDSKNVEYIIEGERNE